MASKLVTHPFVVFKSKDIDYTNYDNFNGKYIIAKELSATKWLYLNIGTYNKIDNKHFFDLCDTVNGGNLYEDLQYGVDYMVSDGTIYFGETTDPNDSDGYAYINDEDFDTESDIVGFDTLPCLIINGRFNSVDFDLDKSEQVSSFNLNQFVELNNMVDGMFTKEELASFCATFCEIILSQSNIHSPLSVNDTIRKNTLEFFANEGTDEVLERFNLLSSLYAPQSSNGCGCTSISSCTNQAINDGLNNLQYCDCSNIYINYLKETLKNMLGDITFYDNWFTSNQEGGNGISNGLLCDTLIQLIDEFIEQGYDLSFNTNKSNSCASVISEQSDCNYQTINNYKKVLQFVKDGDTKYNKNKIKGYGQAFGELLSMLMF